MKSGATSLSHAYLNAKKEDLKQQFDEEAGNLLGIGDDNFEDEMEDVDTNGAFWAADKWWTSVVLMVATATIGLNVMAMVVYGDMITIIAGSITSMICLSVGLNELRLEDMDCMSTGGVLHTLLSRPVCSLLFLFF